jgi:redox-sensitive bicupin YhaK (pirin superfamily)
MITVRHGNERGAVNMGWLDSRHSFSFGHYHDPRHMGFRSLRVINDDRVIGGAGFPTHGHADMEIISYVLEGALEHKDTTGTNEVIRPGEVQRMSAGSGLRHSEYNASATDPVHFLQIWILPEARGITPGYEQKAFPLEEKLGRLCLVGSRDGRDGSITIHQDVDLYSTVLRKGDRVEHELRPGRYGWVQVASGQARVNGIDVKSGDGVAIQDETAVTIEGDGDAEVLLFDLA